MKLLNALVALAEDANTGGQDGGKPNSWLTMLPWIIIIAAFLVFMIIMNKRNSAKRKQEVEELKNSIHVGDKIKTIGGIIGTIIAVNNDNGEQEIVIETGLDGSKNTMVLDFQAIYQNLTYLQRKAEEEAAKKAEQERIKAERHQLKDEKKDKKGKEEEVQEVSTESEPENKDAETSEEKQDK